MIDFVIPKGLLGRRRGASCKYREIHMLYAVVAELADALDSGSSGVTAVEVRVLSTAPYIRSREALLCKASFLFVLKCT
jgi:hypothetical protein